ncbi:RNA polymerase sigma-70 factor, ECF subfamily [Promicromonospora umidemergens]|uniref:ECF RNA polymerase sigma factor SigK n=1 Tax=Promicromonospora umidemergens TaxID=629679 RepID=A0ABP8YCR2_9MICO|nr:sigma-70 family RNA polymerase sigma factor [Promicromonospora umidemergens]MCP2282258.1 RNA polymerase sigma-70 factor, ECF subfamily [Promicromonospora umidemergens]
MNNASRSSSASGSAGPALVACVGADPATFGPVYDALAPVAFGVSLGVVSNADRAAEVTRDVMMEVWQTAALYDPAHASARTWVATIARRRACDHVRAERSGRDPGLRDLAVDAGAVATPDDARDVDAGVKDEALRRHLDSLAPDQREAITVACCRGLTYREVADHLGVEPLTVKTRIRDGLECLCGHRGRPRA